MELRRQLGDVRGAAIAGAVGYDEPAIELRYRIVVRIEPVAPATVQDDDRRTASTFSVVELDRSRPWEKGRCVDRHLEGGKLRHRATPSAPRPPTRKEMTVAGIGGRLPGTQFGPCM